MSEPSELHKAVCLDCQPKSLNDATYVSFGWLEKILGIAHQEYHLTKIKRYHDVQSAPTKEQMEARCQEIRDLVKNTGKYNPQPIPEYLDLMEKISDLEEAAKKAKLKECK